MSVRQHLSSLAVASLLATGFAASLPAAAEAAPRDRDHDGIADRYEKRHGLKVGRNDARGDKDKDGLSNLREYRLKTSASDEDTDNDGHDDADEVRGEASGYRPLDADSDDDGTLDGDEDHDSDGVANEDEDDSSEPCAKDDDDRDGDHVADEDENELGAVVDDADSDDDGISDGDEDGDDDGSRDEDDDDALGDACDGDYDGNGRDDEDEGDLVGVIASFDVGTGELVLDTADGPLTGTVTADTEIEVSDEGGRSDADRLLADNDEGLMSDLSVGTRVAEIEFDRDSGDIEEIEIYRAG